MPCRRLRKGEFPEIDHALQESVTDLYGFSPTGRSLAIGRCAGFEKDIKLYGVQRDDAGNVTMLTLTDATRLKDNLRRYQWTLDTPNNATLSCLGRMAAEYRPRTGTRVYENPPPTPRRDPVALGSRQNSLGGVWPKTEYTLQVEDTDAAKRRGSAHRHSGHQPVVAKLVSHGGDPSRVRSLPLHADNAALLDRWGERWDPNVEIFAEHWSTDQSKYAMFYASYVNPRLTAGRPRLWKVLHPSYVGIRSAQLS